MSKWTCWSCEKPIEKGDTYIKDGDERYCSDCFESYQRTYYFVGGECIGDDDEVQEYSDWPMEEGADG